MGHTNATLHALRSANTRLEGWLENARAILIVTDVELEGLDLSSVCRAINYDLPAAPELLDVRATRLRLTPRPWVVWTLLPQADQLTEIERRALRWAPYVSQGTRG